MVFRKIAHDDSTHLFFLFFFQKKKKGSLLKYDKNERRRYEIRKKQNGKQL